jgi:EPS-associated MarR family transcriptional regulator
LTDELHYRLLKHLQANPQATQRELAQALGISLGRTNYCVRALIDRGWVKAQNFLNCHNKRAYSYLLTPQGIEQKARIAARFLQRKRAEYAALKAEIAALAAEVERDEPNAERTAAE